MLNSLFKLEENWVVFYDLFSKNGIGDSIRPIAEELRRRRPDMKFFFCTKAKKKYRLSHIDMADELLVIGSLRFNYVCSKAKYIVSNMSFPNKGKKRKGQVFIATWHGCGVKKGFLSRDKNNIKFQKYAKQFESADAFCLQGESTRPHLMETFNLKSEQFIESGLPRNDILFKDNEDFKLELKKKLNLPLDKKVILYCPTWRRYDHKAVLPFDLENFKEKLKDEYVFLIRSHVGKHTWVDSKNRPINLFDNEFTFDGGAYPESTHLYLITDVFVSDYSSAVYDFAITRKPQIFYIYDLDEFSKEFGLFYDLRTFSPFPKAETEEELLNSIKNLNIDEKDYEEFLNTHLSYEKGNASQIIVDKMLNSNLE